ncbi:hypothetical protein Tco_1365584 [Tanacetum coccineum]
MGKAVDADLVVTETSGTESEVQDDSSRSGNDTDADDADIRPIYDEEPMAEVQLTAECNIFAIGQQHTEQLEISHEGRVDQYPEQCQVIAIAALKNDLRKLKGNSVDTKFAKTSVLGKPFTSQVDVNKNLSRPVSQHYFPKRRESVFAKPDHMIASSESRNSSKNMPRFSSNDMVHNYYQEEARKKTQERNRNLKSSVMHTASLQNTTKGSKPKPRSNNQTSRSLLVSKSSWITITAVPKADHSKNSSSFSDSKHFVCSTCHKCVFSANHDACIKKLLEEVNLRAKIQSHKTRNSNKPVDQKSHTQKPGRQIFKGHRFFSNKTSDVYEKTSPRSDLRWKPTSRIFKSVGLSAGTSINVQKEQGFDLSAVQASRHNVNKSSYIRYDSYDINDRVGNLFGHLFYEYFNGENQVVSKSSAVTTADASDKRH